MDWRKTAEQKLKRMPEEAKQLRQDAIDDLWIFAQLVNPTYMYGDVHKDIFRWMMDYSLFGRDDGATSNKLVMLPRAHLKSHMVATFTAWIITRHPEITVLYLSATSELAETQLYAIKNIFESKQYQKYFPEYIHPDVGKREVWNNRKICIDHLARSSEGVRDATIATAGLTTNTTGWHADLIIPDDIVVPENAYTEEGRSSVEKKSSQFTSIRNTGGYTLACGTRYHPSDIYDTWKTQEFEVFDKEGEFVERKPVWTIKEHAVEEEDIFIWPRATRDDGKAFGFDKNALARIRAEYADTVQFYAQYYNNPNDPGSNRINRSKFQYIDPKLVKFTNGVWYVRGRRVNIYAAIDFAYTATKRADYTAIVVIGMDHEGYIYVLDMDRFKTDKVSVMFDHITEMHSKWTFRKLRAEVTAAQSMIVGDLKDFIRKAGMALSIDENKPTRHEGTKEERMASILEPRYDNLSVFHIKGGYTPALEEELILARPKHDDLKDTLASAIQIALPPRADRGRERKNNVVFSSRFGGVAFNKRYN
jgi:phage terminase large subunit-like protein